MILFFFFNYTATTEIYTLSLHDALPILLRLEESFDQRRLVGQYDAEADGQQRRLGSDAVDDGGVDRKSTRLNSSHANISYAVFCLKKKQKTKQYEKRRGIGAYTTRQSMK